jgi:hypothetical protein
MYNHMIFNAAPLSSAALLRNLKKAKWPGMGARRVRQDNLTRGLPATKAPIYNIEFAGFSDTGLACYRCEMTSPFVRRKVTTGYVYVSKSNNYLIVHDQDIYVSEPRISGMLKNDLWLSDPVYYRDIQRMRKDRFVGVNSEAQLEHTCEVMGPSRVWQARRIISTWDAKAEDFRLELV